MDELEHTQFIVILIDTKSEEKTRVSPVYNFMVPELQKISHFRVPCHNLSMGLSLDPRSLLLVVCNVPSGQPSFALSILEQNEPYL